MILEVQTECRTRCGSTRMNSRIIDGAMTHNAKFDMDIAARVNGNCQLFTASMCALCHEATNRIIQRNRRLRPGIEL